VKRRGYEAGFYRFLWILVRLEREMWDSVAIEGKKEDDGTLLARVLVFNGDYGFESLETAITSS
jgi:hypothetical protein